MTRSTLPRLACALAVIACVSACGQVQPVMRPDGRLATPAAYDRPQSDLQGLLREPVLATGTLEQTRTDTGQEATLDRLVVIATTRLPALARLQANLLRLEGLARQAGAPPNPSIRIYADDEPADPDRFGEGRYGGQYRQPFVLSSRLGAAERRAGYELQAAELDGLAEANDLLLEVRLAFVAYAIAYRHVQLAIEERAVRERQALAVEQQVRSGLLAQEVLWRYQRDAAFAALDVGTREDALALATQRVRHSVGDATLELGPPTIDANGPAYPRVLREGTRFDTRRWAQEHPRAQAAATRVLAAEAKIEEVAATPAGAWVLTLGGEYDGAAEIARVHLGVEIPLPLLDQAAGAVRAARAEREMANADVRQASTLLLADFAAAERRAALARERLAVCDNDLLPRVDAAVALAVRERVQGRISNLDVDAVRLETFAARRARLDALAAYANAVYRLRALLGE